MTTFVLIPRQGSATRAAMTLAEGARPEDRGTALRQLLTRVRRPGGVSSVAASDAQFESADGGRQGDYGDPHREEDRQAGAPRTLEAIGAVIVDDLNEDLIEELDQDGIDVVENYMVSLEAPIATSAAMSAVNWHLDHINVAAARAKGLRGADVRIGVLDTGIDASHPEFAGRAISFMEFDMAGFKTSAAPRDAGDHGTHVAGIAAGATCGVAPEADLSVAAVLTYPNQQGVLSGYLAQILAGANWLLQSNFGVGGAVDEVDVLNASLGGLGFNNYLYSVLSLAQTVPATQMIASIGNAGPNAPSHGSPGNYDITVGVGACDSANAIAPFSSWGTVPEQGGISKPDLVAPGVDIRSAKPGGGYQLMSGTSMASPVVAGAAALFLERSPVLKTKPSTLRTLLLQNTIAHAPASRFGSGCLDLTNI